MVADLESDHIIRLFVRDFLIPPTGSSVFACWAPPGTKLEIEIIYRIDPPVPQHGLVFTFEFSAELSEDSLLGSGLRLSKTIGPYCYLATTDVNGRDHFSIKLPDGPDLHYFGIRRWNGANQTLIRSLTLREAKI